MLINKFISVVTVLVVLSVSAFAAGVDEKATYKVTFEGNWTQARNHPGVRLPGGAHFSPIIGAVHNKNATLWEVGGKATKGFTLVAELGQNRVFRKELQKQKGESISSILNGAGNLRANETDVINNVTVTKNHHLISLVTMIAPSHDWFIGVSKLSLLGEDGKWKDRIETELFAYDAGTELGEDLNINPSKKENGKIRKLVGVDYLTDKSFGKLTIERTN